MFENTLTPLSFILGSHCFSLCRTFSNAHNSDLNRKPWLIFDFPILGMRNEQFGRQCCRQAIVNGEITVGQQDTGETSADSAYDCKS